MEEGIHFHCRSHKDTINNFQRSEYTQSINNNYTRKSETVAMNY